MNVHQLEEFLDNCEREQKRIMIKFGATWCGPCKQVEPLFDQLMLRWPQVVVLKIDIQESPDIKNLFQVSSIPAFHCLLPTPPTGLMPNDMRLVGSDPQRLEEWLTKLSSSF